MMKRLNSLPQVCRSFVVLMMAVCSSAGVVAAAKSDVPAFQVTDLRIDNLVQPIAIDNGRPHFSWINHSSAPDEEQTAYEVQVATCRSLLLKGKADVWQSGQVTSSESVMVPYGGMLLPARRQYVWRVRTWNKEGVCSAWSEPQRFGTGTFAPEQFTAAYIHSADTADLTPIIMKEVRLRRMTDYAILHVNSLGYHELYVNGRKVSRQVLSPAVSQLDRRSQIVSYDVRPYLKRGRNTIALWLGTGWYKPLTFNAAYGGPVVRAELDVCRHGEWSTVLRTDSTWQYCVSQVGAYVDLGTWLPGQFGGERIDASRRLPDLTPRTLRRVQWAPVQEVDVKGIEATQQMFPGNRAVAEWAPKEVATMADGRLLLDFGRNLTGWFSVNLTGCTSGQEVTVDYADDRSADGAVQCGGERDVYVSAGEKTESFCNKFNHHAFRYAVLSGIDSTSFVSATALQLTADVDETSSFACSDNDINAIHDMVQRTLRCLAFSGYMVDCPHIERQGYGGDGNSSTLTLQTMQDASSIYYNWVQAWADVQDPDGSLPHVAPTCRKDGGGPYWCGFIIQAPWRTYMNYADDRMLSKYYANMQRWLDYVAQYSPNGLLERWPDTYNRWWYLGDWLTPQGVDAGDERSVSLVSNCSVSECLQAMMRIAAHLGHADDAARYAQWNERLQAQLHATYYHPADSTYASASPIDLAYALHAGVVPDALRPAVNAKLEQISRITYASHIAVGLTGVPIFTEWAIRNGKADLMYDILKQPDYPGYLYMIREGATTTWESWNRDRSRIHNCYNGIGTWFYQALAGIRPDVDAPGYRHFFIEPQFPHGMEWAKASQHTPYGDVSVAWTRDTETIRLMVDVPVGTTTTVRLQGQTSELSSGHHELAASLL